MDHSEEEVAVSEWIAGDELQCCTPWTYPTRRKRL